ncbi:Receptor-like protein Cf-9 [Camellia lanceoleosa]|uniref:Receptor-like protein Cf-9 n=1 Tax=Camellia lanceoleosa TaxID=1840588 RepID=A0ACC0HBN5_9ERIC|nr:Receptor-like protein Cf-9 [Camellia lanceoleosa]
MKTQDTNSFSTELQDHGNGTAPQTEILIPIHKPLCHADESSALLQFKQTFSIDEFASPDPFAYPKVASWKLEGESGDCCSWDDVECDEDKVPDILANLSSKTTPALTDCGLHREFQ